METTLKLLRDTGNDQILRGALVLTQSQINLLLGLPEDVYVSNVQTDVLRNQTFFHMIQPIDTKSPYLRQHTDGQIAHHEYVTDHALLLMLEAATEMLREKLTPAIRVDKGRSDLI